MPRQPINVGTIVNDGTGDSLQAAFGKVNANEAELYGAFASLSAAVSGYQPLSPRLTALSSGTLDGVTIGATAPGTGTFNSVITASLKLGSATLSGVGTTAGTVAAGNDSRITGALSASTAAATYAPLASPAFTGTPTAPTPAPGTANTQVATMAALAAAVSAIPSATVFPLGQCRLTYSSATALLLKPYQGNQIWVNGAYRTIPSGGVSLANTGLTAAALYYVYAYMSGSTLTLEAVSTGHATDTTYGHEVKSGDATRTLVGMAYMDAGSPGTFADSATKRYVASWFNRQGKTLEASVSGAVSGATSPSATAALSLGYLTWADEAVQASVHGTNSNNTAGNYSQTQLLVDGAAVGTNAANQASNAGYFGGVGLSRASAQSEGWHTAGVALFVNGGVGTWSLSHTAQVRQ